MREQYEEQFQRFERDIEKHAVTVLRDDGLYRHLRCSTGSYAYSFDVVTWPGYLCYTGDMGCYVFSRIADMFEFFRGRRTAMIDRGYLAEKAVASDKPDGIRVFSEDVFRSIVNERSAEFAEELDESDRAEFLQCVKDEVIGAVSDGREAARDAAINFEWKQQQVFPDFWEHNLEEYTTRFWWCCYAVPWAIEQYDALKTKTGAAA